MFLSIITFIFGIYLTTMAAEVNELSTQPQFFRGCGVCFPNATRTCALKNRYFACDDPLAVIKNCQASKPYCTMPLNEFGVPSAICSNIIENIACDQSSTTSTTVTTTAKKCTENSDPERFLCSNYGKYADPLDPTCTTYYYCYSNNGKIDHMKFKCYENTVFNPLRGMCVRGRSYICT